MTVQVGTNVVITDEDTGAQATFTHAEWNRGGMFLVKDGGLNDYEVNLDYDHRDGGASRVTYDDCRTFGSLTLECR